jgi:hypothetical protein
MATPPKEEWWTPQQIALVEDRSRHWRLTSFQPSDALAFESGGQSAVRKREADDDVASAAHVVPDGWDHEHCALCWQKISLIPDTDHSGYTDGRDWLCAECYEKFIKPRTNRP